MHTPGAWPRRASARGAQGSRLERGLPTAGPKKSSRRLATRHRCALWQHPRGEGTNEVHKPGSRVSECCACWQQARRTPRRSPSARRGSSTLAPWFRRSTDRQDAAGSGHDPSNDFLLRRARIILSGQFNDNIGFSSTPTSPTAAPSPRQSAIPPRDPGRCPQRTHRPHRNRLVTTTSTSSTRWPPTRSARRSSSTQA